MRPAHANLLPAAFRRRLLLRTRLRQWAPVWVLAVLVAAGLSYGQQRSLDAQRTELESLRKQAAPLEALTAQNRQVAASLAARAGRQSLLARLEPKLRPVQVVGVVSQSASRAERRIQVRNLSFAPAPVASPGSTARAPAPRTSGPAVEPPRPPMQLSLGGIATDDLAIAGFVAALREIGVFRSVELRSSGDARAVRNGTLLDAPAREYTVECVFQEEEQP
jgi:hypothetical protein